MGRDLLASVEKVGRHHRLTSRTREREETPFFQRLGAQAFDLLSLRFCSMTFAAQGVTVCLVVIAPPAM